MAALLLVLRIRISLWAWMTVSCACCVLSEVLASGWSLVLTSPTECGASECDREASINRRPSHTRVNNLYTSWNPDGPFTEFTRVRHWFTSWYRRKQSTIRHPISSGPSFMSFFHLRLDLPKDFLFSAGRSKDLSAPRYCVLYCFYCVFV